MVAIQYNPSINPKLKKRKRIELPLFQTGALGNHHLKMAAIQYNHSKIEIVLNYPYFQIRDWPKSQSENVLNYPYFQIGTPWTAD
jgi:hypothetical protein